MNGLAKQSYRLGEWMLKLLQLQLYWLLYTLKGGIVLGIFPATGTVFRIVYQWMDKPKDVVFIKNEFQTYYRDNFKELNQLGWVLAAVFSVLTLDLFVSRNFIQSYFIHYFLVFLLILILGTSLYVFPIFSRYDLTTRNYLKQAFYFFFTNIMETIAMLIGFFLVLLLVIFLPILLIVAGVPLFTVPISWFAYQAMKKLELKQAA